MEIQNQSAEITKTCGCGSKSTKYSMGKFLSIGGMIFMLAGIMFFISLICAIYLKLDIVTAFIIGSLVVGIAAFGAGSYLLSKSK